jgi:hypothetical protein
MFNDNLAGTLTRDDIFLRNAITGDPIINSRWYTEITDSPDGTVLKVFVKGAQPPGQYWVQINPFRIQDDSGNFNRKRVRFNFTIAPQSPISVMSGLVTTPASQPRLFDALFGSEPILA